MNSTPNLDESRRSISVFQCIPVSFSESRRISKRISPSVVACGAAHGGVHGRQRAAATCRRVCADRGRLGCQGCQGGVRGGVPWLVARA
eukprot:1832084-Prymnesium_polylepis.2